VPSGGLTARGLKRKRLTKTLIGQSGRSKSLAGKDCGMGTWEFPRVQRVGPVAFVEPREGGLGGA